MKRKVCAVYDHAVQTFGQPFFVAATGAALRSFTDEVNRAAGDNPLHVHPEDFDLWELGSFDDELGSFDPSERRIVTRGKDVVRSE